MWAGWWEDDPATGRFESEDSAKDGANWSLYAHGDPVNMVDPDGQESLGEVSLASALETSLSANWFAGIGADVSLAAHAYLKGEHYGVGTYAAAFALGLYGGQVAPQVFRGVVAGAGEAGFGVRLAATFAATHIEMVELALAFALEEIGNNAFK